MGTKLEHFIEFEMNWDNKSINSSDLHQNQDNSSKIQQFYQNIRENLKLSSPIILHIHHIKKNIPF